MWNPLEQPSPSSGTAGGHPQPLSDAEVPQVLGLEVGGGVDCDDLVASEGVQRQRVLGGRGRGDVQDAVVLGFGPRLGGLASLVGSGERCSVGVTAVGRWRLDGAAMLGDRLGRDVVPARLRRASRRRVGCCVAITSGRDQEGDHEGVTRHGASVHNATCPPTKGRPARAASKPGQNAPRERSRPARGPGCKRPVNRTMGPRFAPSKPP